MFCIKCGKQIKQGVRFCPFCGAVQGPFDDEATVRLHENPVTTVPETNPLDPNPNKKKRSVRILAIIAVIAVLIIIVAITTIILVLSNNNSSDVIQDSSEESEEEEYDTTDESEEESDITDSIMGVPTDTVIIDFPETEPIEETEEVTVPDTTVRESESIAEEEPADPIETLILESDTRLFDYSDLYDLTADECRIVRNGIYARHGRMFDTEWLQEHFMQYSWYHPTVSPDYFNENVLNATEKANAEFIREFENLMGYN